MTTILMPEGRQRYFNNDDTVAAGCKLYTYAAGTTTPKTAYTDSAGTIPHQNPITLDGKGEAVIFWDGAYKVDLKTADGVQITGYPIDNVQTDPANVWTLAARLLLDTGAGLVGYLDAAIYAAGTVGKKLQDLAGSGGSALVGFLQAGVGAITRTTQSKMREQVSVFDYMTAAEITAVQAYTFTTNVNTAVQTAFNAAWNLKADLFVPCGGYLVTGLTMPGTYPTLDERDQAFRLFGQGYGNPFSTQNSGGTIFKSVTDAPILTDAVTGSANAQGTYKIDHIRFDGNSTTPVILFNGLYGTSSFHNNVIYQRGIGDGFKFLYGATAHISECYSINRDFVTAVLGAARTGVGFNFANAYGAGLVTFSKCSSRGWHTCYSMGGAAGPTYSCKITESECSVCYNGILIGADTNKAIVSDCYFEGGDQGVAINVLGSYATIEGNIIFPGFATIISDTLTTNFGTLIIGNEFSLGAVVNAVGIDITSSAASGGNPKCVENNAIIYTAGTAGVIGLRINGTDPRIFYNGNGFNPRAAWTGAGSTKISDLSTSGVYGIGMEQIGDIEVPYISRGAMSYAPGALITGADVSAGVLTLPDAANYHVVTAAGATAVNTIAAGTTNGQRVLLRTTNANMTISDSAFIQLDGGVAFTGPGMIEFFIERSGANNFAYEIGVRTVF